MSHYTRTNRASSYFFFFGFVFSKLQKLPILVVSTVFNALSLSLYLIGYLLWLTATLINPDTTQPITEWYGFAEFKEQARYSAIIGIVATLFSFFAILNPILLLPAAWFFLISNLIWTISEYHQLNNPPQSDPNYSYSYQKTYLSYATTTTLSSLIGTLSITIGVLFPPIAMPVLIIALICSIGLSTLALEYWLSCTFDNHKATPVIPSYTQITEALGPEAEQDLNNPVAPYHGQAIWGQIKERVAPLTRELTKLACKSSAI